MVGCDRLLFEIWRDPLLRHQRLENGLAALHRHVGPSISEETCELAQVEADDCLFHAHVVGVDIFVANEELDLTVDELQVALSIELVHAVLPELGLVDRVPSVVVLFDLLFPLFEAGELLVVLIEF